MASYLSSLFASKEYSSDEETDSESIGSSESSVDEVTDTELGMIQSQYSTVANLEDETQSEESSQEEEENLNLDIKSENLDLKSVNLDIKAENLDIKAENLDLKSQILEEPKILNKYQEFHCYAANKYLKQAKPVLDNFRFSFSQMFYLNGLKSNSEINAAKEWMSAYKIQRWWRNRNKKIDINNNLRSKYPFFAFPF